MQYLQKGGFQRNPLMRLSLAFTTVFLIAFVVTNFAIYFSKMGLTSDSIVTYYNGSEQDFRPARTFGSMLEVAHMHLPMMALVVLMLTHLVMFAPFSRSTKVSFISVTFLSALLDEGSGWLVRFVSPGWAWLKAGSFVVLQLALIFLLASLAVFLWRSRRESREEADTAEVGDQGADVPDAASRRERVET